MPDSTPLTWGWLHASDTDDRIRRAREAEALESALAGPEGHIRITDQQGRTLRAYVAGGPLIDGIRWLEQIPAATWEAVMGEDAGHDDRVHLSLAAIRAGVSIKQVWAARSAHAERADVP